MSSDAHTEAGVDRAVQSLPAGRAPMLGRARELQRLRALLQAVRQSGRPQTVALTGAAGIGKTRLVREFLLQERATRVYRAAAREGDAPYGVIARLLRGRFGLLEGAPADVTREKLRAGLTELFGDRKVGDVCYLLGGLLGVEFQSSPLLEALRADPGQLAMARRAVLQRLIDLDAHAGKGVLVLVLDDMHYAHAEAHELILDLAAHAEGPVLFLVAGRPELLSQHEGWSHSQKLARTWLELGPLTDGEADKVMRALLAPVRSADAEVIVELVDYAASLALGNPSLLEQMVHVFHDMGVLTSEDPFAEHEIWSVHVERIDEARLPLTVEDAVAARISALSPRERELLERAAVMGGVFWLGGLLAIERSGKSSPLRWERGNEYDRVAFAELLEELTERDYVLRLPESTFPGEQEYVFKHNLERETLVRGVPVATARRWHHAVAEWLSLRDGGEVNDEHLTTLARHYREGGRVVRAGVTYLKAAGAARAQYANARAAELYDEGVQLLLENDQVAPETWLQVRHDQGDALHAIGKNEAAQDAYREMLALAYALDLPAKGGAAHAKLGRLYRATGRLHEAEPHLQAALALFGQADDRRGVASTTDDLAQVAWLRGEVSVALEMTERALVQRRALGELASVAVSLTHLGRIHKAQGAWMEATEAFEQALQLRRERADRLGIAISLQELGAVAQEQGDDARALDLFHEAHSCAREAGDRARQGRIQLKIAEAQLRLDDVVAAQQALSRAQKLAEEQSDRTSLAHAARVAAKIALRGGDAARAGEELARSVSLFRDVADRAALGRALRELAQIQAGGGAALAGQAQEHFAEALALFEELGVADERARSVSAYAAFLGSVEPYASSPSWSGERERLESLARSGPASRRS